MRIASFLVVLLFFSSAHADDVLFPTAPLDIHTQAGVLHFTMEVATSGEQHSHGLMFRTSVPDKHGMLFIFPETRELNFWMKNTLVPLDMLFIDEKGIIRHIATGTTPKSLTPIPSEGPARAVIEIAGGDAAHYHIASGDKVTSTVFP
jgi:uncharacterized membrane protein (UPF0127 family)